MTCGESDHTVIASRSIQPLEYGHGKQMGRSRRLRAFGDVHVSDLAREIADHRARPLTSDSQCRPDPQRPLELRRLRLGRTWPPVRYYRVNFRARRAHPAQASVATC